MSAGGAGLIRHICVHLSGHRLERRLLLDISPAHLRHLARLCLDQLVTKRLMCVCKSGEESKSWRDWLTDDDIMSKVFLVLEAV